MRKLIVVAAITAAALVGAQQAHADTPPKAQATGVYLGGWAAFAAMTEHMVTGKINDLNDRPNIYINKKENPYMSNNAQYDDANGFIVWDFVAHIGDFTYHYWAVCLFTNRKINCGGKGGSIDWHREMWG